MEIRVKEVTPLENYDLHIVFVNGEERLYDMKPLINEYEMFKPLEYVPGLFKQVEVDFKGLGIAWNSEIDVSCEELYKSAF